MSHLITKKSQPAITNLPNFIHIRSENKEKVLEFGRIKIFNNFDNNGCHSPMHHCCPQMYHCLNKIQTRQF